VFKDSARNCSAQLFSLEPRISTTLSPSLYRNEADDKEL